MYLLMEFRLHTASPTKLKVWFDCVWQVKGLVSFDKCRAAVMHFFKHFLSHVDKTSCISHISAQCFRSSFELASPCLLRVDIFTLGDKQMPRKAKEATATFLLL